MASEYKGFVTFDSDEEPLHNVVIDDIDSPHWRAFWQTPSQGGAIPREGDPVRVVLQSGERAGQVADARFAAQIDWWLEGFTPFSPLD